MNRLLAAASLVWLALAPAVAAEQPASLKTLCDRICGGMWEYVVPPEPDQFVTTYRYEWDAPLGLIRGTATTVGGVGGIRKDTLILFGWDDVTKTVWTFRADGEGRPVYGTTDLADDGYRDTVEILKTDLPSQMITTYVFNGADEFTTRSEIVAPAGSTISTEETYKRTAD